MDDHPDHPAVPAVSPFMWRWFTWYGRRFLRKHMHAVRLMRGGEPAAVPPDEPLVITGNHPSWWDPMAGIFLATRLWPDRDHYWPIDARMLEKYRFFGTLGFFGVEQDSRRGAATFLRTATAILARPRTCLWVTAEGGFADVRARPLRIKPGIVHLARRLDRGVILPLAIEYPFWNERTPEVLVRVGGPMRAADHPDTEAIEASLTATMDALAAAAVTRDPALFTTLLAGGAGTSGIYDGWRRAKALLAGRRFDAAHMPEVEARATTGASAGAGTT